jgi:hypothetical protein
MRGICHPDGQFGRQRRSDGLDRVGERIAMWELLFLRQVK